MHRPQLSSNPYKTLTPQLIQSAVTGCPRLDEILNKHSVHAFDSR